MHGIIPELKNLHTTLVAISPEKPDNTLSMQEKLELPFPVLTDVSGSVMRDYQVSWKLPDELKESYLTTRNRDFTLINSGSGWELPIPATFILDQNGKIMYKYVNPNYMERVEPRTILEELRKL